MGPSWGYAGLQVSFFCLVLSLYNLKNSEKELLKKHLNLQKFASTGAPKGKSDPEFYFPIEQSW